VSVAEGDIGDGNAGADDVGIGSGGRCVFGHLGDGDAAVSEGGAADDAKEIDGEREERRELELVGDGAGALEFALFGALSIAEMHGIGFMLVGGNGGADGGVHAAGEADYGARGWGARSGRSC
jgi:hypothetical protein